MFSEGAFWLNIHFHNVIHKFCLCLVAIIISSIAQNIGDQALLQNLPLLMIMIIHPCSSAHVQFTVYTHQCHCLITRSPTAKKVGVPLNSPTAHSVILTFGIINPNIHLNNMSENVFIKCRLLSKQKNCNLYLL